MQPKTSGSAKSRFITTNATWISRAAVGLAGLSYCFILLIFDRAVSLNCKRNTPNLGHCQLVQISFIEDRSRKILIAQLDKAQINVNGRVKQVVIVTSDNNKIFFPASPSAQHDAERINIFLKDLTTSSLHVEVDERKFSYPFGLVLLILSCYLVFDSIRLKKKG